MNNSNEFLKSKTKKVYKSNKLNTANFSNYNLNDYRVYLNAIALIGGVTMHGKYAQPENLTREYRLTAKDFSNQFSIDLKNSYRILKQAADKLLNTNIKVEKPELSQTWRINICEVVRYNETEGTIDILFTHSIMEYLKQRVGAGNFTLYNLKEISALTSLYAVRLYELIQQFNTTTGYLIHTIEQWRDVFAIASNQYSEFSDLKRKVFVQAMDEINNKTDYKLAMTEIKEGRKVMRVRFDFNPDMILRGMDIRTGELSTRHKKQLTVKSIRVEELSKLEAKRAKEKEYRDRHKAKKLAEQQLELNLSKKHAIDTPIVTVNKENITTLMESLALLKEGTHPDQQNLEKMLIGIKEKKKLSELKEEEKTKLKPRKKIFGLF